MNDPDGTVEGLLRELVRWAKESALPAARARVEATIDTDVKKRVYAEFDGRTPISAIEMATGVNHKQIAGWLDSWRDQGLVSNDRLPRAAFSLAKLGIPAPPAKRASR